jgi:hypothetical protein
MNSTSECPTVGCLGSLSSRILARKHDILACLHVFDWTGAGTTPAVSIGFMAENRLAIQLIPVRRLDAEVSFHLLSGVVPEILDSHLLTLSAVDDAENWLVEDCHRRLRFDSMESSVQFRRQASRGGEGSILLVSPFGKNLFRPEFSDLALISKRLAATCMGSPFRDRDHNVKWEIPNESHQIRVPQRPWVAHEPEIKYECNVPLQHDAARCVLFISDTLSSKELVLAKRGRIVHRVSFPSSVARAIPLKFGCYCEVDWVELPTAADGSAILAEEVHRITLNVHESIRELLSSKSFEKFYDGARAAALARQADLLRARKENLKKSSFVSCRGEILFHEPASENDVVILLSKLEAMSGLPFHYFRLLEYTPREGIDAIVNIRIAPEEQDDVLEPLECEYSFDNFLLHEHPLEHVRYVVCWTIGSMRPKELRNDPLRSWLWFYTSGAHQLRVMEMKKFPGIQVKETT